MKYLYLLTAFGLLFAASQAFAQGDLEAERRSLRGISSFYVDVTIEGPKHLTESASLSTSGLIERVSQRLSADGLPVRFRSAVPHLHVHVNMMEVESGLVPFAINAEFYQDARLEASRTTATVQTWDEGVIGLVSPDRMQLVNESIDALVSQFAADFAAANR